MIEELEKVVNNGFSFHQQILTKNSDI